LTFLLDAMLLVAETMVLGGRALPFTRVALGVLHEQPDGDSNQ
jgi:hypothetical protein